MCVPFSLCVLRLVYFQISFTSFVFPKNMEVLTFTVKSITIKIYTYTMLADLGITGSLSWKSSDTSVCFHSFQGVLACAQDM